MKRNNKKNKIYIILTVYLVMLFLLLILTFPATSNVLSEKLLNLSANTILLFFLSIIGCITMIIFIMVSIYQRHENIENEIENIQYDNDRSYIERQIAELNAKLVSTDERWREAYHLIIASQKRQVDSNGTISIRSFLDGFGIDIDNIKVEMDLAFVLTPFHNDYMPTFNAIRETCNMANITCLKGDEEFVPKDILQHIIKCIVKSRIIIANLNGRNPNVFYELGIAHALNKPTILIAHANTEVPFDLKNQYLVIYSDEEELKDRLFDVLLRVMTRNE